MRLRAMNYFNREAVAALTPRPIGSFLVWFFETFFERILTKQIEDAIGWGLETDGTTLAATHLGPQIDAERTPRALRPHSVSDRSSSTAPRPITPFAEARPWPRCSGTRPRGGRRARVTADGAASPCRQNTRCASSSSPGFEREPARGRPLRPARAEARALHLVADRPRHAQRDVAIARALRHASTASRSIGWRSIP
jgi:hypothetical protein